jgi:hypothetical protein
MISARLIALRAQWIGSTRYSTAGWVMPTTRSRRSLRYFLYTRRRPDRTIIQDEWIVHAIQHPLRVVLLEDGETVHNALFDRDFKE